MDPMLTTDDAITFRFDDPSKPICRVIAMFEGRAQSLLAKWDTGATNTCISPELASDIGAIPVAPRMIGTSTGKSMANVYRIGVILPNGMPVDDIYAFEASVRDLGFDMLVGMDVISRGEFAMSRKDGVSLLSFRVPARHHADFTGKHGEGSQDMLGEAT